MMKRFVAQYLIKAILFALIALTLFGVLPGTHLVIILASFIALRLIGLASEGLGIRNALSQEKRRWGKARASLPPSARAQPPAKIVEWTQINAGFDRLPRRPMWELVSEGLGLIAFALMLPLTVALYTCDLFSLRTPQDWTATLVATFCVGLYAWPHLWLKDSRFAKLRAVWWALPFFPAIGLLTTAIETRHPYLNPLHPEHTRLAAERVLSLRNIVVAGRHADWVLRYARELDEGGQPQRAIPFYREALRLNAQSREARSRLALLQGGGSGYAEAADNTISPSTPFWTDERSVTNALRRKIDSGLGSLDQCTVIIVPIGDIPEHVLDCVVCAIHNELALPVYASTQSIALPPHTRVRGLVTGRQWNQSVLVQAFVAAVNPLPTAPVKYLLLTSADIYAEEANYTFSLTYPWGCLVSCARFGEAQNAAALLCHRTAKQSLCALIKNFGVPPSPDHNCVTSYARDLRDFDSKGNRPNAVTLASFRRAVADYNRAWQVHAQQAASKVEATTEP